MKVKKRICVFTGNWEDFEILELVYDLDETKPRKSISQNDTQNKCSESTSDVVDFKSKKQENYNLENNPNSQSATDADATMCLKRRASLFFIISFFAFTIMMILGISLGTEYWTEAAVHRDLRAVALNTGLTQPLKSYLGANPIDGSDPGAFLGVVRFGLFTGCKRFNYGLGVRDPDCFSVFKEHKDVYNIGLVIATIVFILGAIVFGLVATVFGLVNTLTVPIETIHGPVGLYIWNGFGALSSCIAWILYLALYYSELKENVLNKSDSGEPYFFQTDQVQFGYSFWLLIVGFGLFILNILFVFLAQCVQDPEFLWRKKKEEEFGASNRNDVGLGLMY